MVSNEQGAGPMTVNSMVTLLEYNLVCTFAVLLSVVLKKITVEIWVGELTQV